MALHIKRMQVSQTLYRGLGLEMHGEHAKLWGGGVSLRDEMDGQACRGGRTGRGAGSRNSNDEREDQVSPASIGLTIAEGKAIMEGLQRELVTAQMDRHGAAMKCCRQCGRAFRTKGYYQSTLRSVYGKIRMRVRRIRGCSCSGSQGHTYSTLFTHKNPITAELRYLTAKMAALLPFWQGG